MKMSIDLASLLKDTTVIAASRMFVMLYNICLIFILSKHEYGTFSYFDYISQFCLSVSNFGLTTILMKELSFMKKEFVLSNFLFIKGCGLIIITVCWHIYLYCTGSDFQFIIINMLYTFSICFVFDWYFISTNRTIALAKYYISFVLITSLLTICIHYFVGVNAERIRLIQIVAVIISFFIFGRKVLKEFSLQYIDLDFIKSVLKLGGYNLAVQFMQNSALTILTTVIKTKFGYIVLANFSLSLRVCQVISSFRNMAVGPLTKFILNKEKGYYKKFINRYLILVVCFYSVSILFYFAFGKMIVIYLWGELDVWKVLLLLSLIPLWNVMFIIDEVVININKKQKLYFYSTLASFLLFMGLVLVDVSSFLYYVILFVIFETCYVWLNHIFIIRRLKLS